MAAGRGRCVSVPHGVLTPDQKLGAQMAFGPPWCPECVEVYRRAGLKLLLEAEDAKTSLLGGLLIRVAEMEDELARAER